MEGLSPDRRERCRHEFQLMITQLITAYLRAVFTQNGADNIVVTNVL